MAANVAPINARPRYPLKIAPWSMFVPTNTSVIKCINVATRPNRISINAAKNLPTTNLNIEGRYKLSWYWVDINKETKKIIKDEFIVSDKINIKNGKFFFEKLGSSKIISDKYRKNIKVKQHEDNLEIEGELDLDNDDPSNITIMLENKSSHYEGLGILENYEKKTENVKVILTPIN